VFIAAVLVLIATSPAVAKPMDTASAHAGLRAYRAYLSSTNARVDAARRSDEAFVAAIREECSNVLASVSASDSSDQSVVVQFGKEAAADLVLAAFVPLRKPLATLALRMRRLHWSSAASGRRIQAALDAQRTFYELPPSDLCADAAALAVNGGRVIPPGTKSFLRTYQSEASAAGLVGLKRVLMRFRPRSDDALAHTISRLENRADPLFEKALDPEVRKLLSALGLFV
jgi:hypothetical protein